MKVSLDRDYSLLVGTYTDLDALAHNSPAIFKVLPDGRPERTGLVPTGGKFPRHFAITPDGRAVIVAKRGRAPYASWRVEATGVRPA